MNELFFDFFDYLRDLLVEGFQKAFLLFDIFGIVLVLYPNFVSRWLANEVLTKTIGVVILVLSFLLANFTLYRRFAAINRQKADLRINVAANFINPSTGSVRSPFKGVTQSSHGFNKQGLPDWGSLYAEIHINNIGHEEGELVWKYNHKKTKFPSLFNLEQVNIDFNPPARIPPRDKRGIAFYFYVLITEQDPELFAKALKEMKERKETYKLVLTYWTIRVDGETNPREVVITGKFDEFIDKVLEYWSGYGHQDLFDLVVKSSGH